MQWTKKRKVNTAKQIMAPFLQIRLRLSLRAFAQKAADLGGPFITIQGRKIKKAETFLVPIDLLCNQDSAPWNGLRSIFRFSL